MNEPITKDVLLALSKDVHQTVTELFEKDVEILMNLMKCYASLGRTYFEYVPISNDRKEAYALVQALRESFPGIYFENYTVYDRFPQIEMIHVSWDDDDITKRTPKPIPNIVEVDFNY